MARLFDDTYAVVETNNVAAVRTGEIKAQHEAQADLEQGMLAVVDDINREVSLPGAAGDYVYLHASEEQIYESYLGRNSFYVKSGGYPRMMKLTKGDVFETNAVEAGDYADLAAVNTDLAVPNAVYGIPHTSGAIELKAAATFDMTAYEVVLQVVDTITLPNGTDGIKFTVVKA